MAVKQKNGNGLSDSIALVKTAMETVETAAADYIGNPTGDNQQRLDLSITMYGASKERLERLGENPGYAKAVSGALAVCTGYEGRVARQLEAAKRSVYERTATVPRRSTEPFMFSLL